MRDGDAGVDRDCLSVSRLRGSKIAHLVQDDAEVETSLRVSRHRPHGVAIGACGLAELVLQLKHHSDIVMSLGIVGFDRERGVIGSHGLVKPMLPLQRVAEREMGLGVVRVEGDGVLMYGNRLNPLSLLLQHRAKVIVTYGAIRPEPDFVAKQTFGANEISLLGRDDSEVAIGRGMVWVGAQHLLIHRLRIVDRALAMGVDRALKQPLRCRCHGAESRDI